MNRDGNVGNKAEDKPKYEFVPAGTFFNSHGGIAIYIKHTTNPNEIRLREQSPGHAIIDCPDRTLYLVGGIHTTNPFPIDFSFDEMVVPSMFWPRTGGQLGISNYMMNYTQALGREHKSPMLRANGRQPEHNQMIYADSGGFQFQSERFDYINPQGLIEWYNKNVDLGMVLDFPSGGMWWPGLLGKMADAQAKTTEVLLKHKRPDLELLNIFHGETIDDVKAFRETVEHPDIDRLAIGGAYYSSVLRSIDSACRLMTSGKQYKHYHILGVANVRQVFLLMRMASQGVAPYITSDSSTFLQEALNKGYYVWPEVAAPMRYYKIGDKTNRPNSGKILPCSCPVCAAIKYSDVFSVFSGNCVTFLHMYHNIFAYQSMIRGMYDIIRDASLKDLKSLLRRQFATRAAGRDEVLAGFDYVDEVARGGVKSAAKKVAYFLNDSGMAESSSPRSLFTRASDSRDQDPEHSIIETMPADDPRRVRMERILNTYIKPTEEEADTKRVRKQDKIRQDKGHTKTSSGGIRIPGQKKQAKKKVVVKAK